MTEVACCFPDGLLSKHLGVTEKPGGLCQRD
jgi:hypothetical protein